MNEMPQTGRMKPGFKRFLILVGVVVFVFGLKFGMNKGYIPGLKQMASLVPSRADLPDAPTASFDNVSAAEA